MITCIPYLVFNGACRQAMTFYQQCLGGELTMQSVEESPMAHQWPAAVQKGILHSSLSINNTLMLIGSDVTGLESKPATGNAVSISLNCSTLNEANTAFNRLTINGKPTRPMHEFFNGHIGALTDPFGIDWIIYAPKE